MQKKMWALWQQLADAGLVVEAIVENLDAKRELFRQLEDVVGDDCILATNTSSLSITEMAADLEHPERVVGFHFFNPVAVMPLVVLLAPSVQHVGIHAVLQGQCGNRGPGALAGRDQIGFELGAVCTVRASRRVTG